MDLGHAGYTSPTYILKVFDSVGRDSLWKVLKQIQASTKMICMLMGMYDCPVVRSVGAKYVPIFRLSGWGEAALFDCSAGVKQRCLLSV